MLGLRFCLAFLTVMTGTADAQDDLTTLRTQGFRELKGPQIKSSFGGRMFSDQVHFAFRYYRDGRLEGSGMGTKVVRRWWVSADELCQTEAVGENCFTVWQRRDETKLVSGDTVFSEGTLR